VAVVAALGCGGGDDDFGESEQTLGVGSGALASAAGLNSEDVVEDGADVIVV